MAKKHVHITLSKKAEEELNQLQELLDASSIAEVIRSSISMRRYLELEKKKGNDVIIRDKKADIDKVLVSFK